MPDDARMALFAVLVICTPLVLAMVVAELGVWLGVVERTEPVGGPLAMGGRDLERFAAQYDLERRRRVARAWWLLWLGWRDESDTELRVRVAQAIRH